MKAEIINASDSADIERAAETLKKGGLVAFPTETVYGLGADLFNSEALCRVFEVKNRPSFDPLIVHVASIEQVYSLWKEVPKLAQDLMKEFWPGPLTIVLPKNEAVPDVATAGLPTVAVRLPKNEAALNLIKALGRPIVAPSANLFGYTSATSAQAVFEDLGAKIEIILDGGSTSVGVESTIVKIEDGKCILLRPGGISVERLKEFGEVVIREKATDGVYESPGQLESHYAPWTPLILSEKSYLDLLKELGTYHKLCEEKEIAWPRIGLLSFEGQKGTNLFETVEILSVRSDLYEAASNLFRAMRKLDKMSLDFIVAESVSDEGIGLAIMDRLRKASGGKREIHDFFMNLTS